jgi:hypothetical protein
LTTADVFAKNLLKSLNYAFGFFKVLFSLVHAI